MDISETSPMLLGELINKLKSLPQETEIVFDFNSFVPTTFDSWRYNYSCLAIGFTEYDRGKEVTVGNLLERANSANGNTFQGYKGGNYFMNLSTPIMVSNYGEGSQTTILDIVHIEENDLCVLVTGYCVT